MSRQELEQTARSLVVDGKRILPAEETVLTITKRLAPLNIRSAADSRRPYRDVFHHLLVRRPERASGHLPPECHHHFDHLKPWTLRFSYGRALQDPAMEAWLGRPETLQKGQEAFSRRAKL